MTRNFKVPSPLRLAAAATALAVLALAGCSSDDDGVVPPPPPTPVDTTRVPASAGVSVSTFIAYLAQLAVSDTAEPLNIADFTAPTDDTFEPSPVP